MKLNDMAVRSLMSSHILRDYKIIPNMGYKKVTVLSCLLFSQKQQPMQSQHSSLFSNNRSQKISIEILLVKAFLVTIQTSCSQRHF